MIPRVVEVEPDTLDALLEAERGVLVVLYLWGPDCPNCELFARRLPGILEALRGAPLVVAKGDAYRHPELGRRFAVHGIPHFVLFRDGVRLGKMSEFRGDAFFVAVIREHLRAE